MNELVIPRNMGLVPTSMSDAMRLAELMATAKLVPLALQKSPADCLLVIQQAVRWQMDPFAVAQECSVIQGKLMHSGKLVAAVVNSRGELAHRLSFAYHGAGQNREIIVTGLLQGEKEPRTVSVRLTGAKTNNRVWQTQPDQQLMYHGVRVWARRHMPELMLGVYSPEEFDEGPRVLKKDTRELFHALQQEMDAASESVGRILDWQGRAADRIATLPRDWQEAVGFVCQTKMVDLANGKQPLPSGEILAERWGDKQGRSLIEAARPAPEPARITSTLDDQPETGEVIWDEETPPEWSSKWDELGPVKQAGILCNEASFVVFLQNTRAPTIQTPDAAAAFVRTHCKVKSRADIKPDNYTGQLWRDLVAEYRAWQREPDSPPRGETADPAPSVPGQAAEGAGTLSMEDMAREAAMRGRDVFDGFYRASARADQAKLRAMKAELEGLMPDDA